MANQYLMAVDAGTGSVRAVLFDEKGGQLGCVQREWTHAEDPRYPGSMDFDWKHNWALASECIRGVIAQTGVNPGEIAAVSTTCMPDASAWRAIPSPSPLEAPVMNHVCMKTSLCALPCLRMACGANGLKRTRPQATHYEMKFV